VAEPDYVAILQRAPEERELAAQGRNMKSKAKRTAKQKAASMRNLRKAQSHAKIPGGLSKRGDAKRSRGGKRLTRAERKAISIRNLKKARAAALRHQTKHQAKETRRGSKTTHRLTTRAATRSTQRSEAKMKKGKRQGFGKKAKRSKGKLTKAERRAISMKNLRKAQRSNRIAGAGGAAGAAKKHKRSKSKSKSKTKSIRKADRQAVAPPKPHKAKKSGGKRKTPARRTGKRRFTQKARAAAMKNLRKARAARSRMKRAGRKHPVRAYSYHSKPKRVRVPAHRSYEGRGKAKRSRKQIAAAKKNLKKARAALRHGGRRSGARRAREGYGKAMANALSGVELFIGGVVGVTWFMLTDLFDRILATHALTDKNTKDASGHELFADVAPSTGDYANAFNATAICAPMNVWRWLAGLGMTFVPIGISFAVENDVARSSMQMAGFGAGVRIFGKALIDLVAYVTMWSPVGQQLYDGEMRAQVIASGNLDPLSSLPSTGLGAPCECAPCKQGVGACEKAPGTGYPSMPREAAAPSSDGGAPPPPAPPAAELPPPAQNTYVPPGNSLQGLQGVPVRNPFQWGHEERDAA